MEKTFSQKITFVISVLCYFAGVAVAAGAMLYESSTPQDPIRASLVASAVFFISCGIVLHVIATTRLKGLISGRNGTPDNLPADN